VTTSHKVVLLTLLIALGSVFLAGKGSIVYSPTTLWQTGTPATTSIATEILLPSPSVTYIEIIESCGPHFEGTCVSAHTKPSTTSPTALLLRSGMNLRAEPVFSPQGELWYKIAFDEWLRYPWRVTSDWYVASSSVRMFEAPREEVLPLYAATLPTKRIVVDRSEQKLYAYENDVLFMEQAISTGLALTPTPRGTFHVFRKTPSRYMQGPLPNISDQYYDLAGVPWNLYFTYEGGAIHGAYWHDKFGQPWSHGCVNMPPEKAKELYLWAEVGTEVMVRD
jgi:hypothetical protein